MVGADSRLRSVGDHYRIERSLGHGGMSDVYVAHDEQLERDVVIKVVRAGTDDVDATERVKQEARRTANVVHPNIVAVHEVGTHEGVPFIVMEHVGGETLADRMSAGTLSEQRALEITDEVCQALEAAHRNGLVHADVKPSNILLTEDGRVKLTDFGIARALGDDSTQERLGTIAYVSPEQAQGQRIDVRSDVYSLGVVLYEMLTGRRPHGGETPAEMVAARVFQDPTPPREIEPTLSSEVQDLLLRALARDRGERYPSAAALRADTRRILRGRPADATKPMPEARPQRPQRWWLAAAGLVAVSALAGVMLMGVEPLRTTSVSNVPDVTGHDLPAARAILESSGLELGQILPIRVPGGDPVVVGQHPASGEDVVPGSPVDVDLVVPTTPAGDAEARGTTSGDATGDGSAGTDPRSDGGDMGTEDPDGAGPPGGAGPPDDPPGRDGDPPGRGDP